MRIPYPNKHVIWALLVSVLIFCIYLPAGAAEISIISVDQLNRLLDNPEVVIIDVRLGQDWQSSPVKIKGAVRRGPKKFKSWAHDFPMDKTLVLY
jgi:hypothetical protein